MMTNNLRYPQIMEPGELSKLNQNMIDRLGVPLFFATPQLGRPKASNASGRLYEIVTGLYIIYHDYGIRLLDVYMDICKEKNMEWYTDVINHINHVKVLRGGFCHGSLDGGTYSNEMCKVLMHYFPQDHVITWPAFPASMTEAQCRTLVNRLSDNANEFVRLVVCWADEIQKNTTTLQQLRQQFRDYVFNKDQKVYGKSLGKIRHGEQGTFYFDQRIVRDYVEMLNGDKKPILSEHAVQQWLSGIENQVLAGTFSCSEELSVGLYTAIEALFPPQSSIATQSSSDIVDVDAYFSFS